MVWNQYVYEATTGNDVDFDSDGEFVDEEPGQTIDEWEDVYSEELTFMWGVLNTLLYDAHIEHHGNFADFVEFCYDEHDKDLEPTSWECQEDVFWYEERFSHIWRTLRRIIHNNRLYGEMMRGATFDDFTDYMKKYMSVY
jgi:hypothetical protein